MSKPTPYASKVAVPPEEDVRQVMGDSYKPDGLTSPGLLAGTGDCFPAVVALVKALFQADDIDARLREIVTLRVAVLLKAPYEWQQNSKMALNTGLSQIEIDAVAVDGPVQGLPAGLHPGVLGHRRVGATRDAHQRDPVRPAGPIRPSRHAQADPCDRLLHPPSHVPQRVSHTAQNDR